jgi:hypothetical protein
MFGIKQVDIDFYFDAFVFPDDSRKQDQILLITVFVPDLFQIKPVRVYLITAPLPFERKAVAFNAASCAFEGKMYRALMYSRLINSSYSYMSHIRA